MRTRRLAPDLVVIVLFLLTLVLPGVFNLVGPPTSGTQVQNRTQAKFPSPTLSYTGLLAYPALLQDYFRDYFGLRELLVWTHSALIYKVLDASPTAKVLKGKENWLYLADDGGLDDYKNLKPFTPLELESWKQTLEDAQKWLAEKGIVYLLVIVPDKHVVYPEYLPESIQRSPGDYRFSQLVKYLAATSTVDVLDLSSVLLEGKQSERVYHLTDSHWNDRGALRAHRAIVDKLDAVGVCGATSFEYQSHEMTTKGLDLARMLNLEGFLSEQNLSFSKTVPSKVDVIGGKDPVAGFDVPVVRTQIEGSTAPRAVIFRDSFASFLIPYLSESFSYAAYYWQYNFDPQIIEKERPQVVIQEIASRRFVNHYPYNPFRSN